MKAAAQEYYNAEYAEMHLVAKQLCKKLTVFPKAIQILIEKVSKLQAMLFNELQNLRLYAFRANNLKSLADTTWKTDMDGTIVPAPHLPGINTFGCDADYPKPQEKNISGHLFAFKDASGSEPEGMLGHLLVTKP